MLRFEIYMSFNSSVINTLVKVIYSRRLILESELVLFIYRASFMLIVLYLFVDIF